MNAAEPQREFSKLPADIETEQDLLGLLLLFPAMIDGAATIIKPEVFSEPFLAEIYGHMLAIHAEGRPVTPLTLTGATRGHPVWTQIGVQAHEYFSGLARSAPSAASAAEYARTL